VTKLHVLGQIEVQH